MSKTWTSSYSFISGAIRDVDIGYFVMSYDAAADSKIPLSNFIQWEPDGWADCDQGAWHTAGLAITAHPLEQMIAVSEFGKVWLVGSGDEHEEEIVVANSPIKDRGPLRGVRRIGENIYVAGMNRQVYRRDGVNQWSCIENGIPRSKEVCGFESIDGFSEQEIYAVGWDGEIWSYLNAQWRQEDSPVNTVLLDVCCGGDGFVYACGRNGVLVKGKRGAWEAVDLGEFSESLWSLAWFKGSLYASSMDAVFVLGEDGFTPVFWGEDVPNTSYDLVAGHGMLWSVGAKDVMSFDGEKWSRID